MYIHFVSCMEKDKTRSENFIFTLILLRRGLILKYYPSMPGMQSTANQRFV